MGRATFQWLSKLEASLILRRAHSGKPYSCLAGEETPHGFGNPLAGVAVAVGVVDVRAPLVFGVILEQQHGFADNAFLVGAHQPHGAGLERPARWRATGSRTLGLEWTG